MMQHEGWHGGGGPPTISALFDDLSPRRWDWELGEGAGGGGEGRRDGDDDDADDGGFVLRSSSADLDDDDDGGGEGHAVNDGDVVSTVRITYFSGHGTAVGINVSHLLGDASSCFRFCQVSSSVAK